MRLHAQCAKAIVVAILLAASSLLPPSAAGYEHNRTVADKRNAANAALGTCPQLDRFSTIVSGGIDRRWNTTFGANVRTNPNTVIGETPLSQVRDLIQRSFATWTNVAASSLRPASLGTPGENPAFSCNSSDGFNTICFSQGDPGFTTGVLAFTTTLTSDILGEQFAGQTATFIGEILDADILVNPTVVFATPAALPTNTSAFDLESVLTHELGHFFGFSHSGVWRAMMFPFAPSIGTFLGNRPSLAALDAPLSDDDRTGLRVLYPDPGDATHTASISGRVLPANPLSLSGQAGVTGIFGAHIVAVDEATGGVRGATLSGWSCGGAGPVQFDGSYTIERLEVNRTYKVYAEPLDGPVSESAVAATLNSICRPYPSDVNYPPQFSCTRPAINTNFVTRVKP